MSIQSRLGRRFEGRFLMAFFRFAGAVQKHICLSRRFPTGLRASRDGSRALGTQSQVHRACQLNLKRSRFQELTCVSLFLYLVHILIIFSY